MISDSNIADALKALEGHPDYRVLKRLPYVSVSDLERSPPDLVGIVVDVETTGLDVDLDEVIELGMIKFGFDRAGNIGDIIGTYQSFNEPSIPISASITRLTGIGAADVKGAFIRDQEVTGFLRGAALVIAHNAPFDRPFCEKLSPEFRRLSWACTATEIPWKDYGLAGARLEYIVASYGRFYDAHRALDDCNAVINILGYSLPGAEETVFDRLLKAARRADARIFADGAPFDARLTLKRRGYRWNDGTNGYPRAWWRDIDPAHLDAEARYLEAFSGGSIAIKVFRMNSRNRFRRTLSSADLND